MSYYICMKRLLQIIVLVGLLLYLSSCTSINKIYYEVLYPADTLIDLNITKIDIVNKYWIDYAQKKSGNDPYKFSIDSIFSFESIKTVYNSLTQSPRFAIARVDTLPGDLVNSTYDRIELQNVNIDIKVITEPIKNYHNGMYYGAIQIAYSFNWALISWDNQNLYNKVYKDTVWVEGSKRQFTNIADLVDFNNALYYIMNKTAVNFADAVSPHWRETYRYIFVNGHNDFVIAADLVADNKWDEAELLWQRHIYGNNRNLAGKANYNMAIKNEKDGNLLDALHFINVAIEKYNFQPAKEYAPIIKKRIGNIALIESQLP